MSIVAKFQAFIQIIRSDEFFVVSDTPYENEVVFGFHSSVDFEAAAFIHLRKRLARQGIDMNKVEAELAAMNEKEKAEPAIYGGGKI